MKLILFHEILPHPYSDEPSSRTEVWAKFGLKILDNNDVLKKIIFETQWNILDFLSWLIENKINVLVEEPPFQLDNESVANSVFNFYENILNDNFDNDDLLDKMYEYRTHHSLVFGLRGTNVIEALLAKQENDYTLSFKDENLEWCFTISNLNSFYVEIEEFFRILKI